MRTISATIRTAIAWTRIDSIIRHHSIACLNSPVLEFPAQHSPQGAELESEPAAAKLRTGNIRSADSWEKLLLPEIERQQKAGKEVILHADAAFAEPEKLRKMAVAHTQQADGA